MEARVEDLLLQRMPQRLEELAEDPEDALGSMKDSMLNMLKERPSSTEDEVSHFWPQIANGKRCFGLRGAEAAKLKHVDVNMLRKAWGDVMFGQRDGGGAIHPR